MQTQMCPNDVAWDQAEETSDNWIVQFLELDILRSIADFILNHNRGNATEFAILRKGSYNISLRIKYRKGARPAALWSYATELGEWRFLDHVRSVAQRGL